VARSLRRAKIQDSLADDNPRKTLSEAVALISPPEAPHVEDGAVSI
jgi:hypothetical protein